LKAIPEKKEARLETKKEDKDREAEARPKDNEIEEATREVVELPKTPLATQVTLPDNINIVTRAVKVTSLAVMVVTSFM